jgi:hypothetical protein
MFQAKGSELFRRDGAALQFPSALFKTYDLRLDRLATVPFFDFG